MADQVEASCECVCVRACVHTRCLHIRTRSDPEFIVNDVISFMTMALTENHQAIDYSFTLVIHWNKILKLRAIGY